MSSHPVYKRDYLDKTSRTSYSTSLGPFDQSREPDQRHSLANISETPRDWQDSLALPISELSVSTTRSENFNAHSRKLSYAYYSDLLSGMRPHNEARQQLPRHARQSTSMMPDFAAMESAPSQSAATAGNAFSRRNSHQRSQSIGVPQMARNIPPAFNEPFKDPWGPTSPTRQLPGTGTTSATFTRRRNSMIHSLSTDTLKDSLGSEAGNYRHNLSNLRHQHRKSFASTLSTTFEDMELGGPGRRRRPLSQQYTPIQPPLRIDPPPPSALTSDLRSVPRRQSVAAGYCVTSPPPASPAPPVAHDKRKFSESGGRPNKYVPRTATLDPRALGAQQLQQLLQQQQEEEEEEKRRQTLQGRVELAPAFAPIRSQNALRPLVNAKPKFRRAAPGNKFVSPLSALTTSLTVSYSMCVPEFDYRTSKNPRRVLTKPSQPVANNGYDNEQSDYILYVNDVLGVQESRRYMVVDIVGHGAFGQVVKCQNLDTQEFVAVKVIKSRPVYTTQSITEARILEYLNRKVDPNDEHHMLRLKDKFMHGGHFCLVFELLASNLYELLGQNQFHGLTIKLIKKITAQLLDALCVLKNAELIHCDLKPENVLLVSMDRPDVKVIDFGSACNEKQVAYNYVQSRFYRSPEVILGLSYSAAVDVWSLGCIVAELFLGLPLFPGTSELNQLTRIVKMLGMPPMWMIDVGMNSANLINKKVDPHTGKKLFSIKSPEQFSRETHTQEKPSKEYFKDRFLDDIILNYSLPKKNMSPELIQKEREDRLCLIDFLKGLLSLNPLERWTPQEASMHPFVTGQRFNGRWNPATKAI